MLRHGIPPRRCGIGRPEDGTKIVMIPWTVEGRNEIREVGVEDFVRVREEMRQTIADRWQSIVVPDLVEGIGMMCEYHRSHQAEQGLPKTRPESTGNREVRHDETRSSIGTPVRICHRHVRNGGDASADRQRQAKITDHDMRAQGGEQL